MMNIFKPSTFITRALGASAIAAALALSAGASAQSTKNELVGNPYTPTGADYSITALQGIDSSNPGGTSSSAQVVLNFEDSPSIGVAYSGNNGKLTPFGLGLYANGGGKSATTEATGLLINYDSLVNASTANLTLEDFDITDPSKGFKTGKVEPLVSIYGANNQLLGTADPSTVLSSMQETTNKSDVWNLNVGTLLSNMKLSSTTGVSKILLTADSANGEKNNSDPYEMVAVGKAQPVPEPASLCILGAGVLFLRRRRKA